MLSRKRMNTIFTKQAMKYGHSEYLKTDFEYMNENMYPTYLHSQLKNVS